MKKLVAALALFTSLSALADHHQTRHMVNFNAEDLTQLTLGIARTRDKDATGSENNNSGTLKLDLNYFRTLESMPSLQLGGKITYNRTNRPGDGDNEIYGLAVGGYWNFMRAGQGMDLSNAMFVGLLLGYEWNNTYGGAERDRAEYSDIKLSIGKRVDLSRWGLKYLTYSPELAFVSQQRTNGGEGTIYSHGLELRVLQFSVLW